jgi:FAD/FMN-containing dehydrogenase
MAPRSDNSDSDGIAPGVDVMIDRAAVRTLRTGLRGDLLEPGDGGYDEARRVFNAMIDRRPALIARCAGTEDVVRGIAFARTHGLALSVRGGGHSVSGNAACNGGMMLDLSGMKEMRLDPARRLAAAQAGLTLGEFDRQTHALGLATTLGVVSLTGIAGLTLGGGLGWLNGQYGLACDNLVAAELVTADGRVVTASAAEHPDLFWGIRGGGGNFGVVTEFTYQLHPVDTVLAGTLTYAPARAGAALRAFHAFAGDSAVCPDALSMSGALWLDDGGAPTFSLTACYSGPADEGERALRPLRAIEGLVGDTVRPMSYLALQR